MKNAGQELVELANKRFGNLTVGEAELLRCAVTGDVADCAGEDGDEKLNKDSEWGCWEAWRPERKIRAELIRWLCVNEEAKAKVDPKGIQLLDAYIPGELDLEAVAVSFPVWLDCCALPEGIVLHDARTRTINLNGCHTLGIGGDGVAIDGALLLRYGFTARGEVRLLAATISSDLSCSDGKFQNASNTAINADRINVRGSVFLQDKFTAEGEVRFLGATVGGNFDCIGGTFRNKTGDALSADGINVSGSVFLKNKFTAEGTVRFLGATIGGDFICISGTFQALTADRINVRGSIFLKDKFTAQGEVRFLNATIGGNFTCADGTFLNKTGKALSADGIDVRGDVFLTDGFIAKGEVRFPGATVGGNFDCTGGTFRNKTGHALAADGISVRGDVFLTDKFTAEGEVRFPGANIKGNFECQNGNFNNTGNAALRLEQAEIGGSLFMDGDFKAAGAISLLEASTGCLADKEDGWPEKEKGKLVLSGFRYGSIGPNSPRDWRSRLRWLGLDGSSDLQPYTHLAKVLATLGRESDARRILIEAAKKRHRNVRTQQPLNWFWWPFLWVLQCTIGYGYNRWRPLFLLLLFWIFGALLFGNCFPELFIDLQKPGEADSGQTFSALIYSADTLVQFIDFHQEKFWLPDPEKGNEFLGIKAGALLRRYLWIHISAGWVLGTVFVVGLTGVVRRVAGVEQE